MMDTAWNKHKEHLATMIFDCSNGLLPEWLTVQAQQCVRRYDGIRTTPEFQTALKSFSQQGTKPFELFVVGEGNFGKSTAINALLAENRCKVSFLPETRTFHRLILKRNPVDTVRVLARLDPTHHDWMRTKLGPGKPVPDFFELMEYRVALPIAQKLLKDEVERGISDPHYPPAIFEVEEEIPWTPTSPFPENVRIVDTQGLGQDLPESLRRFLKQDSNQLSSEIVLKTMSEDLRGRHLLWQYRRCDAALWLLRAGSSQSAVTKTLFNTFSSYGKKTILIVTVSKPEG
jgi:septin family protein